MKMFYTSCFLIALAITVQSGPIPKQAEQDDAFAEVMYSTFYNHQESIDNTKITFILFLFVGLPEEILQPHYKQ